MHQSQRPSPEREAELIGRCLAGDAESFGEIVVSYERRIFATVYRILGHAEDSRDLAQEVFLRAWSKLSTFREGARFSTWLYTLAKRLAVSRARASGRRREQQAQGQQRLERRPRQDLQDACSRSISTER